MVGVAAVSCRMIIWLFERFTVDPVPTFALTVIDLLSLSSRSCFSPRSIPPDHPNSYGFARGLPFTLSRFSSIRGKRIAELGYIGALAGKKAALKTVEDGERGGGFAASCFNGEVGRM